MIIVIILFFIALAWLIFFVFDRISEKFPGKETGAGGELPSLGIFGGGWQETDFLKANCSDENLKAIWDFIFKESSNDITIVSDKNVDDICSYSLMYKILDNNMTYFISLWRYENKAYVVETAYSFYGNFTDTFLTAIKETTPAYVNFFFNQYLYEVIDEDLKYVQGYRNISNVNDANNEYNDKFKIENESWMYRSYYGGNYYYFLSPSSEIESKSSRILENKTLDFLGYSEGIYKPINLTQTKNIENIEINGSKTSAYTLYLDDYFENVGYGDSNLSIRFNVSFGAGPIGFSRPYFGNYISFNTSDNLGGEFTMNIILSHLGYNGGENVTTNNFNVTIYGCLDSDESSERYDKTTAQNLSENKTDFCVDSSNVMEYYCSYQNIRNYSLSCDSGYYCSDGACVINTSVNHAPVFNSSYCDDLSWEMNKSYTLDMRKCFYDEDDDALAFRYENASEGNLSISRSGNDLMLIPATNWVGSGYFYIYANDSEEEVRGTVDFIVFRRINITANITTNQTNLTANNTPKIKSPFPSSEKINISSNESLKFSITAENYDSIKWYVDGVLIKSDVSSYTVSNLSEGEHEIKVEVGKGSEKIYKTWNLSVSGEETPKKDFFVYFVIILVGIGILILVVVFFIVKNMMEKKEENVPKPVIKELKPGIRISYIPPSKPSGYSG